MTRNNLIALAVLMIALWSGLLYFYSPLPWLMIVAGFGTGCVFTAISVVYLDSPRRK